MMCLMFSALPAPDSAISNAAKPATCGDAWLVPSALSAKSPTEQGFTGTPTAGGVAAVKPAIRVLLQSDQTQEILSTPHGHTERTRGRASFPPGAATLIACLP